jgi:hypothetical protein
VSKDVNRIVPAAYYGQVDTLFVAAERQQWGRFDADANTVTLHTEQQPGDEDLLDLAAMHTLLHRGTVIATDTDKVPDHADLAAILRWTPSVS